jgi:hypothetical protein
MGKFTVFGGVGRTAVASLAAGAAIASSPGQVPATYEVTLLPGSNAVFVKGRVAGITGQQVNAWIAGMGGLGEGTELRSSPDAFEFAYSVAIPKRQLSNSPESEIDEHRFRSWGSGVFLVPNLDKGEVGPIRVCFKAPREWTVATPQGAAECIDVPDVDGLLGTPILAGDVSIHSFRAAGAEVVLALRDKHPVAPAEFQQRLARLVTGASDYLGAAPPEKVFFGVDRLGDGKTYAPGNNVTTAHQSATLLIDNDAGPANRKFWGTYAHEYVHTWMPRAFGNAGGAGLHLHRRFLGLSRLQDRSCSRPS